MLQKPFQIQVSPQAKFEKLSLGEIKPTGWLKAQMQADLTGVIGNLDKLAPDLIDQDDIYGANRLSKKIKNKNVGALSDGGEWHIQFLWWNSETQSNWRDAWMRQSMLVGEEEEKEEVKAYIEKILATQDTDGYLGIYDTDLRYQFNSENGELWSKATLYRVLLGYYEASKEEKVLKAVISAVENVIQNYPIGKSSPFKAEKGGYAGLAHGLMFTDILDCLAQFTKDKKYLEYALFLYQDYSRNTVSETDIQLANILDDTYLMKGHGVHSYEHLRALLTASCASENPDLRKAVRVYLNRIDELCTPTGGAIGDEYILERKAHAARTGYEYCALQELLDSYACVLQKQGDVSMADKIERLFLNAAQGARHPEKQCIAYLKTDNSYEMQGKRNGDTDSKGEKQTRYKYSPVHQDVAVCCVPNSGRISAYYVQNMFLRDAEGLVMVLLGACDLRTKYQGKNIIIQSITEYPYQNQFVFEISTEIDFYLKIRKPAWVESVNCKLNYQERDGLLIFKIEKGDSKIRLTFDTSIQVHDFKGEYYFTYGALVYAHPIEAEEKITRDFPVNGFHDYQYTPINLQEYKYIANYQAKWANNEINLQLKNKDSNQIDKIKLIPISKTILRQVTFEGEKYN
jgi:hypothetical protein